MPLIKLTPDQHLSLRNALLAAFPNSRQLSELLLSIGQNYDMLEVPSYDLMVNVRVLIKAAESEDWLLPLVLRPGTRSPSTRRSSSSATSSPCSYPPGRSATSRSAA